MRRHAVGVVIKDRLKYTEKLLESLYYSEQDKRSYDLFLIDNGSNEETQAYLRRYAQSGLVEPKNLIIMPEVSIPQAWNLFLALTTEYDYRTKLDNDLILGGTILLPEKKQDAAGHFIDSPNPADVDPKAGAPISSVVIKGIGQALKRQPRPVSRTHSCFLQHMTEFSNEYDVAIVGLVPVAKGQIFNAVHQTLVNVPDPCLSGHCLMITRKAFDTLGYFDERLLREIDKDYTRRAIKSKLNIGYHPFYGVIHLGHEDPTEGSALRQQKVAKSTPWLSKPLTGFVPTIWQEHENSIREACSKNKIVSLI